MSDQSRVTSLDDIDAAVSDNKSEDAQSITVTPSKTDKSQIVFDLDQLIKQHLSSIDKLKEQHDKASSTLEDIFNNDSTYRQHSEAAKEAAKIKSATKQQILKQPQAAELSSKVKTLKSEIKELQGALSDYLREYQRMTGVNEIEDDAGEVREIVYTARLVKKFRLRN